MSAEEIKVKEVEHAAEMHLVVLLANEGRTWEEIERGISKWINFWSLEEITDTPGYLTAKFLVDCLRMWEGPRSRWPACVLGHLKALGALRAADKKRRDA